MANATSSSNILPPISMFTSRSNNSPQTFMPASPPSSGYDKQLSPLPILPKQPPSSTTTSHYKHHHHHTDRQPELLSPPLSSTSTSSYYQKQPSTTASSTSSTSSYTPATPDQSTLWALFSQFQQQQQQQQQEQQKKTDAYRYAPKESEPNRRASDPTSLNNNTAIATSTDRVLTSEEVLAEKRRRNAGASARFRDRRKQRERELQDKCHELEQRSKEFENALRRIDPDHPLLLAKQPQPSSSSSQSTAANTATSPSSEYHHHRRSITSSSPPPHSHGYASDQSTLFDRVGQLEHLMTRFREEKETDVQKLDELEKENKYLRSLLVPVSLPSAAAAALSRRDSATDSDSSVVSHTSANGSTKRKQHSYHDQEPKRPHLSLHQHHSNEK
ncbi:basic-leucine zipper transcription factor [Mucor lusitanicus]|uniref:Basic-leucine zipper transcription factor n=2 Tax=Mucor circinelloides f. lusitanicus TaxID=29924 RepID=A0A168IG17_MUCCL|nr:basic-leucine zipper transcription factor [Mucor lusitanicus]OAC99923.1 basic-leucine zipper transcription factor [Mucor lusitanicus CBS 277.49]